MTKFVLALSMATMSFFANAQSLNDAKKAIYYERYQSAKNILQPLLTGENGADAAYWLSIAFLKENKPDSAYNVLKNLPGNLLPQEDFKEYPLPFIAWARILLDSNQVQQARAKMEAVLDATKYKNAEALLAAATANIESSNGDVNWAIELLNKALKRDKKNPDIFTALGDAYFKLTDGGAAVSNYQSALRLEPSFAEAPYKEGLIYKTQKNEDIYLEKFKNAYAIDSTYSPAIYELYNYYFFKDVAEADKYLNAYVRNSDPDPKHAYMLTDLQYVSKKYQEAINSSNNILAQQGDSVQPRLYKLMAYSYAALGDSATALTNINTYFTKQADTAVVPKDYSLKAQLLEKVDPNKAVAVDWYKKALNADTVKEQRLEYVVALADLEKQLGNREEEAYWRGRIYEEKQNPTNLDIYKWGMALYAADDYERADSVFAIYEHKYPDQIYGYLMRARANALLDSTMEKGLAVPHYEKLAEVAVKDSVKNKDILLKAYQYLGAYEATVTKDYNTSLEYYDKVLSIDPQDAEAEKNAKILSKWIDDGKSNN